VTAAPRRKWRPPLRLVVTGALLGTLALSAAGLVALRLMGPEIGFLNAALAIGGLILVATLVLGGLLARLVTGPVTALERHAAQLIRGDDPPPPARFGTRELARLGASTVAMARALRRREASVRSFADHASHELKTPISTIRASAELLADGGTRDAADAALVAGVLRACTQAERQLAALRAISRAREPAHHGSATLRAVADRLVAEHPGLAIGIEAGADAAIPLAPEGLRIVLHQIASNASEAGAGRLTLAVRETREGIVVTACDDGPGISAGNAAHLFEPFYTTRRAQGGTGMGLTIADALLSAHGARIAYLADRAGACFELTFDG
jgi:signal transduction histidine kinase